MRSIWNTNKMVYQRHSLSYQFNEKSTKFNGRCSDKIIIDTLELYDRERDTHLLSGKCEQSIAFSNMPMNSIFNKIQ